jgi:hypothetical protein
MEETERDKKCGKIVRKKNVKLEEKKPGKER